MSGHEEAFEAALERAGEEAIEEFDAVEEDADVSAEEESLDESPESEEQVEEPSEVEDEVAAEDEDVEQDAEVELVQWNGNPDELPDAVEVDGKLYDLQTVYKAMQAGWTKKTQQLADERRQAQELAKQYGDLIQQAKSQAKAVEDPRPANPTEDMSPEEQNRRWDEINRWIARDEQRRMVQDGTIPDPEMVREQYELQKQQYDLANRINMIAARPDYSKEIDDRMVQIVEADESGYWRNQFMSDEGALALFDVAKNQLAAERYKTEAAKHESANIKRKATAASRATPKQTAQNRKADPKPADNCADLGFSDKIDALVDQEFEIG